VWPRHFTTTNYNNQEALMFGFKKFVCGNCGTFGRPKHRDRGSLALELSLWVIGILLCLFTFGLAILIPIIYSIWRCSTTYRTCRACGSERLIPENSPVGRTLWNPEPESSEKSPWDKLL
jgi:hypothetical protein